MERRRPGPSPSALGTPLGGPTSYAIALAFTPDSRLLAVGSADKTVQLWNVPTPRTRPRWARR